MLGEATPIAFVTVASPERARAFYSDALGLELVVDEPFALVYRTGSITLRLAKAAEVQPAPGTVFGWQVADVAATVADLGARGVAFERFEGMQQDAAGIWTAPGGARVAWFRDPDGNLLSVSQMPNS